MEKLRFGALLVSLLTVCPLSTGNPEEARGDGAVDRSKRSENVEAEGGDEEESDGVSSRDEGEGPLRAKSRADAVDPDESEDVLDLAEDDDEDLPALQDSLDAVDLDEEEVFLDLEEVDTSELSPFSFRGVLDLTYVHFESDENVDGFDEDEIVPLHPMLMFGYAFHDRVAAVLEVEWEGLHEEFEVEQLYVEWTVFVDLLKLGVGRHVLPFGVFRYYHSPMRNDLVDEPAVFRAVYPEVNPDLGVFVRGEYDARDFSIGYEMAFSNGLHGPDRQAAWGDLTDNNDSKWFTGRLSFAPAENLTLGASYSGGQYDRDDKLLAEFQGFDVQYRVGGFRLKAEWVGGFVERPRSAGGNYYRHGWYAELARPWPIEWEYLKEFEMVFRYDDLDANNKVRDRFDLRRYSFGGNLVFNDNLRWKLQYEINDERHEEIANDGFLTQIEFHW